MYQYPRALCSSPGLLYSAIPVWELKPTVLIGTWCGKWSTGKAIKYRKVPLAASASIFFLDLFIFFIWTKTHPASARDDLRFILNINHLKRKTIPLHVLYKGWRLSENWRENLKLIFSESWRGRIPKDHVRSVNCGAVKRMPKRKPVQSSSAHSPPICTIAVMIGLMWPSVSLTLASSPLPVT